MRSISPQCQLRPSTPSHPLAPPSSPPLRAHIPLLPIQPPLLHPRLQVERPPPPPLAAGAAQAEGVPNLSKAVPQVGRAQPLPHNNRTKRLDPLVEEPAMVK